LLGGYATGTLTEAERARLFAASLEDQELFDALADEQQWKDLLDDPESRGYLLAELDQLAQSPAIPEPVVRMAAAAPAPAMRSRAGSGPLPVEPVPPPPPPVRFWMPFTAVMLALLVTGWFWWRHEPPTGQQVAKNFPPASAPPAQPATVPEHAREMVIPPPLPRRVADAKVQSDDLRAPAKGPAATPPHAEPKTPEVRQDVAAPAVEQAAKKERDLSVERRSENSEAKVVAAQAPPPQTSAAPPAPAMTRSVPAGVGRVATLASAPEYRLLRFEDGQFVPRTATTRFTVGDRIVILLPAEPTPQLVQASGAAIALERDGDWYRSAEISLQKGSQEFMVSTPNATERARFAADRESAAKSKAAPVTGLRIRLNVD
jgi:hypothetical protein